MIVVDFQPVRAGELARLQSRRTKLDKMALDIERAMRTFERLDVPDRLTIRRGFVIRDAIPGYDVSDRRLPPRHLRPPATRLVSPRGIALKVYLTALFVAQTRKPRSRPQNKWPIDDRDALVSWVDFFATPAEAGGRRTRASVRDKKARQFQDALRRLAAREVQLVSLPNQDEATGKYEGFVLLLEGGAPYDGGENDSYTVPTANAHVLSLPAGLITNGWIHVLEDSELAMLLMVAWLHSRFGEQLVFAAGDLRLLRFGLGRDAYQAHEMLRRFGLLEVVVDEDRALDGRGPHTEDDPSLLHRFRLLREGFDQEAVPTVREVIERRIAKAAPPANADL